MWTLLLHIVLYFLSLSPFLSFSLPLFLSPTRPLFLLISPSHSVLSISIRSTENRLVLCRFGQQNTPVTQRISVISHFTLTMSVGH